VWRPLAATMTLAFAASLSAQPATFQDPTLDRMVGTWLLRGTIAGAQTTHDVDVAWVLGHQYVRLHEVSREKDPQGRPAYEAIVFIGWDATQRRYACLWLDSTGGGGLAAHAIAHAERRGNEIPFVFTIPGAGPFHTTFVYEPATDTWRWLMDGEEGGRRQPFARVQLTRR
jgi:hypothetical protein